MAGKHIIFFSVAGLRPGDVCESNTPTLYRWANGGALAEMAPTFPCVTSCVQASMWTGAGPGQHGVIANGFYDRARHEVAFWVAHNNVIQGEQVWELLRSSQPGVTSAVWHAQNIKGASADFIVTPAPIHEPDGTTKLWCYSKPDALYADMLDELGHFPLQHYWGPLSSIESTRWVLRAASWLIDREAPNLNWIYIPHLDYAAQKFGPNSPEVKLALHELDAELAAFETRTNDSAISESVVYVVAGEYALTDVTHVVHPNRLLREAGLLTVDSRDGVELIDFQRCAAFAMVDHQVAHVFVLPDQRANIERVRAVFANVPGVDRAYVGAERDVIGVAHDRSGDIVLVADDACWFAYYWWMDDTVAPPFARTVDIHQKPGYDPVELFLDSATNGIPLDAGLVRGSHGVPAMNPHHRTALICSHADGEVQSGKSYRDTDIKRLMLEALAH